MKKWILENKKCIIASSFVFVFFAIITYLTPLAGDDWGYAINGMKANPVSMAIQFYQTWSGRFFSELWGFVVAPKKWLWNILNPTLFTVIFVCIQKLSNPEDSVLKYVLTAFLMLFASDYLRMETYTWIMGTTYVVPLAFSLLYFVLEMNVVKKHSKMKWTLFCLSLFLNFYIGLCMENIAAVMVMANVLLVGYRIVNRENARQEIAFTFVSLLSLVLIRVSPGAAARLAENTAWNEMTLVEQLLTNMPHFIRYSFYDNKYLILVLNAVLLYYVVKNEKNKVLFSFEFLMIGLTSFMLLSNKFYSLLHLEFLNFINLYPTLLTSLAFNSTVWILYIVLLFEVLSRFTKAELRLTVIFFAMLAGASNVVMMVSPIFGARSSIYFFYFCIVLVICLVQNFSKRTLLTLSIVFLIFSGYRATNILKKYRMVDRVHQDRLVKIQYYLDHPEEKDVWLPRMPIYTVHGADIEVDDTYHMTVFKAYYGLADDCVLHFYVEE